MTYSQESTLVLCEVSNLSRDHVGLIPQQDHGKTALREVKMDHGEKKPQSLKELNGKSSNK